MAPNSLSPASVVIDYHSAYGQHRMTLPTKEWFPTDITGTLGSYENWATIPVDAETMIRALCTSLTPFVPATWEFDSATIYTQASPTAPNIPRRSAPLGIVGTGSSSNPSAAFSATFNFVTTGFGKAKIVLLDSPFGTSWLAPLLPADFDANVDAVITAFCLPTNAWSGRDDNKPNELRKVTYDVNDKLQKMYFG